MRNNPNFLRTTRLPAAVLATLALTGCGDAKSDLPSAPSSSASATATSSAPAATTTSAPARGPMLEFNDLGGGSPYIQVYPGVSDSATDRVHNAVYPDGTQRPIECHLLGRLIVSDSSPEVGEEARQSRDWYLLKGPDPKQYATATYGDVVPAGAAVQECPAPV